MGQTIFADGRIDAGEITAIREHYSDPEWMQGFLAAAPGDLQAMGMSVQGDKRYVVENWYTSQGPLP